MTYKIVKKHNEKSFALWKKILYNEKHVRAYIFIF